MMTVHEVSKLTGVSIRTLQYYDKIHLLSPSDYTESGYKEFEEKAKNRTKEDDLDMMQEFMDIFKEFGEMKEQNPGSDLVQAQVKKLQAYITEHFYNCTPEILSSLGKMYSSGGEFTENIDKMGGAGTADFSSRAIEIYCGK